jgi:hypothetical protein
LILDAMSTLADGLTPPRTGMLAGELAILLDPVAAMFVKPRRSAAALCRGEPGVSRAGKAFKRVSVDRCLAAVNDALHDAAAR